MKQQEQHQQSLLLDENNSSSNITTNINNNNKHTLTPERVKEFVQGLGQIFNEALSTCLLYPQEQPQYKAWMLQQQQQLENSGTNQSLVDCYGCEYLLRLLVRLPMLLHPHTSSHSHLWWSQPHLMGPLVAELIVLMQKNRPALFSATGNYRRPEPHEQFAWELPTSQRTTESMDTR